MVVAYHEMALLIAYFSELSPIRITPLPNEAEPFLGTSALRFVKSVLAYRDTLVQRELDYLKHNADRSSFHQNVSPKMSEELEKKIDFPSHLYSPIVAPTFGAPDSVGLCFVDDIDAVSTIGIKTNSSRFKSIVSFCPTGESIRNAISNKLSPKAERYIDVIGDPQDLFEIKPELHFNSFSQLTGTQDFSLSAKTGYPLLLITEINLSGMASMTRSGLAIDEMSTIIARKLVESVSLYESHFGEKQRSSLDSSPRTDFPKFIIAESQGDSDLIVLSLGCNINQIASSIVALRNLQFKEYEDFPESLNAFNESIAVESIKRFGSSQLEQNGFDLLSSNHIVGSTQSCIAVSAESIDLDPEKSPIQGFVRANTAVSTSCGHLLDIIEKYKLAVADCSIRASIIDENTWPMAFSVGAADLHFGWSTLIASKSHSGKISSIFPSTTVTFAEFLELINAAYSKVGTKIKDPDIQPKETGILSLDTTLQIPLPNIPGITIPSTDTKLKVTPIDLIPLFEIIGKKCFKDTRQTYELVNEKKLGTYNPHEFDLGLLRSSIKRAGFPRTLRRSILSAYEIFAELISDYQAAHHVLDLFDAFSTLYQLLCHDLQLALEEMSADERYIFSDDFVVEEIHLYINAIWASLKRSFAYLKGDYRDFDFHFGWQTNLQKYIHAADSVLKCGVGIKKAISSPNEITRRDVASILELSDHPRTVITRGKLSESIKINSICNKQGSSEPWIVPTMSRVRLDFSSLFTCFSYMRCLHESIHMVRELEYLEDIDENMILLMELERKQSNNAEDLNDRSKRDKFLDELFVSFIQWELVFSRYPDIYARYSAVALSLSPGSNISDPTALISLCVRYLTTVVFIDTISHLILQDQHKDACCKREEIIRRIKDRKLSDHKFQLIFDERFEFVYKSMGKLFSRFYLFKDAFANARKCISVKGRCRTIILTEIKNHWDAYFESIEHASRLLDQFFAGKSLKKPSMKFVSEAYENRSPSHFYTEEANPCENFDELMVVCSAIGHNLSIVLSEEMIKGRAISFRQLEGDSFTGDIIFINDNSDEARYPSEQKWAEIQVDPISSGIRCAKSKTRRNILATEIVLARTIMSVSNRLIARRLNDFVESAEKG